MTHSDTPVLIRLGDLEIQATQYEDKLFSPSGNSSEPERKWISFDFVITGGQEYHDVTTLLYHPTVEVQVPDRQLQFQAAVHNYFTSVPRLEKDSDTVDVHLELIETIPSNG
ncbi:DUF3219 family protein [Paenibacillus bovis]|uniref:DUF3219 domain-containing protein n=1 Tax=Paenibacillus bovis TaxID=1616788 RepID=A0A172ZGQ2_9BACL|nr:DUF3219 family protein [Paenibacillus bovis]ANF96831.1 hypothetical protein AR543_12975 [Paenibacillus bovis]